jgi:hypothetical protein
MLIITVLKGHSHEKYWLDYCFNLCLRSNLSTNIFHFFKIDHIKVTIFKCDILLREMGSPHFSDIAASWWQIFLGFRHTVTE